MPRTGPHGMVTPMRELVSPGPTDDRPPPRHRARELIVRHGWNATAYQTLGEGYSYFFHRDGCVAYVDTGSAWVVAGAPIAETSDLAITTTAFVEAARQAGRRCCFFAIEERFLQASCASLRFFRIGEQPAWDPEAWSLTLARHAGLREQLRRARAKEVRVRRVKAGELDATPLGDAIRRLIERWLATRAMPPMGFLVQIDRASSWRDDERYIVAERHGQVVGFAKVLPVPGRGGWFVEHLVRAPTAPNGTVELLIDAVMQWAVEERCAWLTLGLAPSSWRGCAAAAHRTKAHDLPLRLSRCAWLQSEAATQ